MHRTCISLGLSAALASGAALAVAPDGKTIVMQGTPNATPCLACHGIDGAGNAAANFPRLAGLDAAYLAKQLADYRNGSRVNPVMAPIAQGLNEAESAAVAAYFSKQQPIAAADFATTPLGERLAARGNWSREIPACFSCHAPGAKGVGVFPALAGQHAGYIAAQIHDWKSGARRNDAVSLMKAVADRLSEEETQAVAEHLAGLKPGAGGETP